MGMERIHNLKAVFALSSNYTMGNKNELPWYIPEELIHFKNTTKSSTLICGMNTYRSMKSLFPLSDDRHTLVISASADDSEFTGVEGITRVHSVEEVISIIRDKKNTQFCVIGGAILLSSMLDYCSEASISIIHNAYEGDISLKHINEKYEDQKFEIVSTSKYEQFNVYNVKFI